MCGKVWGMNYDDEWIRWRQTKEAHNLIGKLLPWGEWHSVAARAFARWCVEKEGEREPVWEGPFVTETEYMAALEELRNRVKTYKTRFGDLDVLTDEELERGEDVSGDD